LAVSAVACSSDDNGAAANGGSASGGTSSAGSANGGAHSGGANAGSGGSAGKASGGNAGAATGGQPNGGAAGDVGAAGEAGTPNLPGDLTEPAVYAMTNDATVNQIVGFLRAEDGSLTPMAAPFATGGKGSGAGLGEQGALAYDLPNHRIYTVNAGDNSFSVFAVKLDGSLGTALHVTTAEFGDLAPSLVGPKSITFHGDTVYVLFEGTGSIPSMIAGWSLSDKQGALSASAIAKSALPLSSATQGVDPAQIEFSPDGTVLVVTEKQSGAAGAVKGSGAIDTFTVSVDGLAKNKGYYPTAKAPVGDGLQLTPFGFEFSGKYLVISEAGSQGTGSYTYAGGVIAPVANGQFVMTDPAPCWVTFAGNYSYVTNAKGPSISGFSLSASGALSSLTPITNAIVASTGEAIPDPAGTIFHGPTDEFVSQDGRFLYALNSAVPSIGVFAVQENGTLERVGEKDYTPSTLTALPKGSAGIVAR